MKQHISPRTCNLILAATCVVLFFCSFAFGAVQFSFEELMGAVTQKNDINGIILYELRLPRTILALAIGAALGLSGAVMQCWLRNPLADAGLLGTSSTAALGAVIMLYFGLAGISMLALPIGAILAALGGVAILVGLLNKVTSATGLILAGLAIQYMSSSGVALALNFAPNPHAALEIAFWLMGSLKDRSMEHVYLVMPFITLGCIVLMLTGRKLDALSLGEATAMSLGVNLKRLTLACMIGSALAVGASVAVSGVIGFIGLIVPHVLRHFVGSLPSKLLLPSALGGAALLLASDMAIRAIPVGQELKLGVATSLVGAPFFFYLLFKMKKVPQ